MTLKDFNFFKPFINKKSASAPSKKIGPVIGFVLLLVIAYPLYNYLNLRNMTKELEAITTTIQSEQIQQSVTSIREINKEIGPLKDKLNLLNKLNEDMQGKSYINKGLLDFLASAIPRNTKLTHIEIADKQVYISGDSNDLTQIAKLANNIRGNSSLMDISILSISKDGIDAYSFTLTFSIKEVINIED